MKTIYTTALLALCGFAASAQAQVQAGLNDLILGFRATGGQGQNVSLEVDLGSVSQYYNQPAGTSITISRLAVADLVALYGSNWNTRTDLVWGIVGTSGRVGSGGPSGQPLATLWATKAELAVGTQSIPFTPGSRSAQANASASIEPVYFAAPGSLTGATNTANSSTAASLVATLSGSYAAQDTNQPGVSFGFFNPSIDNTTNIASGSFAVSDLYELQPGAAGATYLGSFGLSSAGVLTFKSSLSGYVPGAPSITTAPVAQSVSTGGALTLSVTASGTSPLSYQWSENGTAIPGATSSTYTVASAQAGNAGSYTVTVSNSLGSVTSSAVTVAVGTVSNPGRLINLSVLTSIALTENLTVGFVVGGGGTTGSKPVLVRAMGPSLSIFLPAPLLDDPVETYFNGSTQVSSNDNWGGDATVTSVAAAVGAFPFLSSSSKDAALYISDAALGNDSVIINGVGTVAGSVLAEVYDATPGASFTSTTPRLLNVSVLKNMGSLLTVGFTVGGSSNRNVLIRAVGPSLALTPFNLPGVASDPRIQLFDTKTNSLQSNDNWGGTVALTSAMATSGAFALPAGSLDAAIIANLPPGGYSVQVTPAAGSTTGTVLVDLYELP